MSGITFHDCSSEIQTEVFSYLQPNELAVVSLVCSSWHQLANDNILWKDLFKRNFPLHNGIGYQNKYMGWKKAYQICTVEAKEAQKAEEARKRAFFEISMPKGMHV